MKYRTLGRTGLRVSEIGFGGWAIGGAAFGNSYGPTDDAASARRSSALELGCTFSTRPMSTAMGHSEELLGQALHDAAARDQVIIATKVGANFYHRDVDPALAPGLSRHLGRPLADFPADAVLPVAHGANFRPDYLRFACEQSLRRLRREVIDLYQLHNPGLALIEQGEIWQALDDLKQAGKIRFYGVSIHQPVEGIAALVGGKADTIQVVYNLLDQAAASQLFPWPWPPRWHHCLVNRWRTASWPENTGQTRALRQAICATWPGRLCHGPQPRQTLAAEWCAPAKTLWPRPLFALRSIIRPSAPSSPALRPRVRSNRIWPRVGFGARGLERGVWSAKARRDAKARSTKTRRREGAAAKDEGAKG
ncbi:aldo/keto reductase [Candidatus Amarolinea dominans]|uniref:aldo/keto reductase n=1 Tax=Candidatus Amarolinea dominans TaxID=3140696 RepID=UPI003135FB57|nr:aldo/keto reductase [Anaerolineae bacterium]